MPAADPVAPTGRSAPPGWYPDPVRDGRGERWWSGTAWTGRSRPTPPARPAWYRRSFGIGPAWASLLFGLVSAVIAVGMLSGSGYIGVSWFGVLAVVLGARALRQPPGGPTRTTAAVLGIVTGGVATLVMVGALASAMTHPSTGPGYPVAAQQGVQDAPLDTVPTDTTPSGPLDVVPKQPMPDDALDAYVAAPVRSTTASSAGCGVMTVEPQAVPLDGEQRTARRLRQDYLDLQVQAITGPIRQEVKTTKAWPRALDVDPETGAVFLPAPSCEPLGKIPKGVELRFGSSKDHGQIAIALWDPQQRVGTIWRSVDDTIYQL